MSSNSITEISQTTSAVAITGSVIPLTTIFTPAANCNQESGYETAYSAAGTIAYNTDPQVRTSSCYPPSYRNYQYEATGWYSPGVCPQSYEYVATSVHGPTTLAICCPPGFHTKGLQWSCTQIQTKQLPGDASVTVAFANPISVAWQSSDLDHFVPKSAPILALAEQTNGPVTSLVSFSSSSSSPTTTTSTRAPVASSTDSSNTSMSTGEKAGIGIGIAVAVLAIIGGLSYWFLRNKKQKNRVPAASTEKRDMYGENMQSPMTGRPPAELGADGHVYEAANTAMPYEAPTKSNRHELQGDMVPELSQHTSPNAHTSNSKQRW